MSSGLIQGLRDSGNSKTRVIGAEPLLGNDAARSLKAGHIVANETEPLTIADGARTMSLGEHNWAILKDGLETIVEVPEEHIEEAVRLLFVRANLKAEPTGALAIAALLTQPELFRDRSVCCVVTGGNVDPEVYRQILSGDCDLAGLSSQVLSDGISPQPRSGRQELLENWVSRAVS